MKFLSGIITTATVLAVSVGAQVPQPQPPSDRPVPLPRAQEGQRTPPTIQPRVTAPEQTTGVNTNTNRVAQAFRNVFVPLKWQDLPAPVQNTVKQQGGSEKIADIDREDRRGQTVYEVEFEREGRNVEIHVAADGKLLADEYEAVPPRTQEQRTEDTADANRRSLEGAVYVGPKLQDLPAPVQATIGKHAKSEQIADIDIERRTGRVVYEVEFETAGRNAEIHITEDGALLPEPTGLIDPSIRGRTDQNLPTPDLPLRQ